MSESQVFSDQVSRIMSSYFDHPTLTRVLRTRRVFVAIGLLVAIGSCISASRAFAEPDPSVLAELGRVLFFDVNLSQYRTQSCASCHDPEHAFTDSRDNGVDGAASLGDDGRTIGDRNAPSAAYVSATPSFHKNEDGNYVGGLFLDGRATNLAAQAIQPLLNPTEMGLPNVSVVTSRVQENPVAREMLLSQFGADLFTDPERTMNAIGASINAFEQTEMFAPFDSKYDRYLRGEYQLTALEEMGRSLFTSPLTNCSSCHLLNVSSLREQEPFTNYRYHNIGLPPNVTLRSKNGSAIDRRDHGLLEHPDVDELALDGKFKVPSLRNVAVTAPYMHNGVFRELKTAILFYNKYTIRTKQSQTNPESGLPWGEAEVPETIDIDLLNQGQPIDDGRAEALIAFLNTLTDARYEHLIGP